MTTLARSPYVVRTRRTGKPQADEADGDNSYRSFGDDAEHGVEIRIQTERGSLSLKVWRNQFGDEQAVLRAFQHKDFAGRNVGLTGKLWEGTIDGQWHGQTSMFGDEPE